MQENLNNPFINITIYDRLPNILKSVTNNFSGRERDIFLTSSLGVLSSLLPNVSGYYDGNIIYSNLYFIVSAPPASGKGVVMKAKVLAEKVHEYISGKSVDWSKPQEDELEKETSPNLALKIIPANTSTAQLYEMMNNADDGILIIESEADTMGNMLSNDWSNYSDVLRKSFHHESISVSRKYDGKYISVEKPKLSVVLSGTPAQLKSIISSKENGLLSRFLVYSFDEVSDFKNVFEKKNNSLNKLLETKAKEILEIYKILKGRKEEIIFDFTDRQKEIFLSYFSSRQNRILDNDFESLGFISNLKRLGLIFFRISMILTVYRNTEVLSDAKELKCSNEDFIITFSLLRTYFQHSLNIYKEFDFFSMSEIDEELMNLLPGTFSTEDIYAAGVKLNFSKRTIHYKLNKLRENKIIRKLKNGIYRKS